MIGLGHADPLRDPLGVIVLANCDVSDRCTMLMIKSSHTPVMSDSDDQVHFQGFGDMANCSAETMPDLDANAEANNGTHNEGQTSQ